MVLKQHKEFDRDTLLKKELEEHRNMCENLIGEIDEVFFLTVPEEDV